MPGGSVASASAPFQQSPPLLIRSALLRVLPFWNQSRGRSFVLPGLLQYSLLGRVFRRTGASRQTSRRLSAPSALARLAHRLLDSLLAFQQTLARGLLQRRVNSIHFGAKTCFALVVGHLVFSVRARSSAPSEQVRSLCGRGLLSLKRAAGILCCVAPTPAPS